MIQYIYTTTKICIPDSLNLCDDSEKLWNFTYVKGVDGLKKVLLINDNEIDFINPKFSSEFGLKCFSGEPQLEKIMDDGEFESSVDHRLIIFFKLTRI